MIVELTQFMRPDGRQVPSSCEVADELGPQYQKLQEAGCRLTSEVLATEDISLTVEHREGDFDMELCENAPGKPKAALENLIRRFDAKTFGKWLRRMEKG